MFEDGKTACCRKKHILKPKMEQRILNTFKCSQKVFVHTQKQQ